MGCIRIERILDYVIEPLRRGIRDSSPYVRKTSALCIAKIFDLNAEVSEDCGFLDILQELLMTDSNPMVVSNVVAALADIQELVPDLEALKLNDEIFVRLVVILSDCTEWGQVFIMDTLADYEGSSLNDIEKMIEIVIPKLQHANQAVVMSAIHLLVLQGLESKVLPENHQLRTVILRKLSSPLISILSPPNPSEIQYAALRNVNLLVQEYPKLFGTEINAFFCSYNDPQYVKLEKLEIIGKIVDDGNIDRVLPEMSEYAKDVDSEIVKKAIKVLSKCALNVPRWSGRIREIFMELLETRLPIVLQQVTNNLIQLLRSKKCRDQFIPLIEIFYFSDLESIWSSLYGDSESQSSLIWILGEFCNSLNFDYDKINEILNLFECVALAEDSFKLEDLQFQTQIVLSTLKIFLKNSEDSNCNFDTLNLLKNVLKKGIEEGESVDLKDRCVIYERILNNFNSKKESKPPIHLSSAVDDWGMSAITDIEPVEEGNILDEILNDNEAETQNEIDENFEFKEQEDKMTIILLNQLTKLSSIYHQLPADFVSARTIMKDCSEGGCLSPMEQSIKSLSLSTSNLGSTSDLPVAWTKLLRNSRPAVANLLDLSYSEIEESKNVVETITQVKQDKYANLLDLLD